MADEFDDWFWTSKKTEFTCPGFGSAQCKPPNACARDPDNGHQYCCDRQEKGTSVCWSLATKCTDDGKTINCGSGNSVYCCLSGSEKCTETTNQVGICWHNGFDTLNNISYSQLNSEFSSASSGRPSATSWRFDPAAIQAKTAPPPTSATSTSTSTSSTSSGTPPPTSSAPADSGSGSSITGGAIAGIVVAAFAAVAVAIAIFFFMRRRRRRAEQDLASSSPGGAPPGHYAEMDAKSPRHHDGGSYYGPNSTTTAGGYQPVGSPGAHSQSLSHTGGGSVAGGGYNDDSSQQHKGYYAPPPPGPVQELAGSHYPPQELPTESNDGRLAPPPPPGMVGAGQNAAAGSPQSHNSVAQTPMSAYKPPSQPPR